MKRIKALTFLIATLIGVVFLFGNLKAEESNYHFEWENTELTIPLGDDIKNYSNKPKATCFKNGVALTGEEGYMDYKFSIAGLTYDQISTSEIGEYKIILQAILRDKPQIFTTESIWIRVVDNVAPKISVIDDGFKYHLDTKISKKEFIHKHFKPIDNYGNIRELFEKDIAFPKRVLSEDILNFNETFFKKKGNYSLTYVVRDFSGNETKKDFKLNVVDEIPPRIEQIKGLMMLPNNKIKNYTPYFKITDNSGEYVSVTFQERGLFTEPGKAKLIVTAKDSSGNTTTEEFVIEIGNHPPKIIFSTILEVEVYEQDIEKALRKLIKRIDFHNDNIYFIKDALINYENLDITRLGTYEVFYTLKDKDNSNIVVEKLKVKVIDSISPVIKVLTEDEKIRIPLGETNFDYRIIEVSDNFTNKIDLKVSIPDLTKINFKKVGVHPIRIEVTDCSKNKTVKETELIVYDNIPPKLISLFNENELRIHIGEEVELRDLFEINDNYYKEEDFELLFFIENNYLDNLGSYTLRVTASLKENKEDLINQAECEYKVFVYDEISPEIYLYEKEITYFIGEPKPDLKFNVRDIYDNDTKISKDDIAIEENINYHLPGRYIVKYKAKDNSQNECVEKIVFYVDDNTFPSIELDKKELDIRDFSDEKLLKSFKADSLEGYQVEVLSDIPENIKPGTYLVTYRVFNSRGLYKDYEQEIFVSDTKKRKSLIVAIGITTIISFTTIIAMLVLFKIFDKKNNKSIFIENNEDI